MRGNKVTGLREVLSALESIGLEVDDLKGAFGTLAQLGTDAAQAAAPYRTGKLRGNIRPSQTRNRAVVTAGGARVPYAPAINYGWRAHNIAPRHYLQAADDALRPKAVGILEDEINRIIRDKGLAG